MNKFQKWLEKFGGDEQLAKRLGVTTRVVNHWRRGEGWPKIESILAICRLSRGELTVDDVIRYTNTKKARAVERVG